MTDNLWDRRSFLRASLAGMLVLLGGTRAISGIAGTDFSDEGRLTLYNIHNGEKLTTTFRTPDGEYDLEALIAINWILRCHYTNEVAEIDLGVIEFLNRVDNELGGGNEIHVISGYRSILYNDLLRRQGRQVAEHSLHMQGKAIDIAIPRVGTDMIWSTALNLRSGGVGYYPEVGFVHIDSGPFRYW